MSHALKSPGSCLTEPIRVDVADLIDAMVIRGGLSLNDVKKERPLGLKKRDVSWSFWCSDGRAVELAAYWVQEGSEIRQYIMLETALTKVTEYNAHSLMEFALAKARSFPSIFKLALADDVITVSVRAPVDGLTPQYLSEVIDSFDGFGATVLAEIRSHFGSMSLLESFRAEDEHSRLN